VFGALTSCALKVSDHFYGTGESFLFRFKTPLVPAASSDSASCASDDQHSSGSASPTTTTANTKKQTPGGANDLEVFEWTGDNIYFIKGNNESLAIGSGE
jgi:hypothetical protein